MTIHAGGETWHKSDHVSTNHLEVLDSHIAYVLDNWTLAGDRFSETYQCWQRHYMAIAPDGTEAGHMVRVVTETEWFEDFASRRIVTAFRDSQSARHLRKGDIDYFSRIYRDLEVRNA